MSEQISLVFQESISDEQIQDIYNFNIHAFADTQDFEWSIESIKKEIREGWTLLSVRYEKDIVAAVFVKIDNKVLFTKNTPIKIEYQGNGFSHLIKEFYEEYAGDNGANKIVNYCPDDNFRMISLNEGHDYNKTGNILGSNSNILEWEKVLSK